MIVGNEVKNLMLKRIYHSAILNSWFNSVVVMITSIIAIPIVISKLTVPEINVWFLFASITALGQGVLFGFNTTFLRFIVYSYSGIRIADFKDIRAKKELDFSERVDPNEFSAIFHLMNRIYNYIALVYLSIMIITGYFVLSKPISALPSVNAGWIAWTIIAVSTTISLRFGLYQIFLEGIGKVALVQRIRGTVSLLGLVFIIMVLYLSPSLISIISIYQGVAMAVAFSILIFSLPERRILVQKVDHFNEKKNLLKTVIASAWKSGITTVSANIIQHISSIIVSQLFPPAQSAIFLFTKRLFDVMETFTQATFQARLPIIAKYRSRGDIAQLLPYIKQTQWFAYGVFLVGYLVLILFGNEILLLLNAKLSLGEMSLIMLFSFSILMRRWLGFSMAISNQSNHLIDYIIIPITGVCFFVAIYFLYPIFGVNAFPFAQILSILVIIPIVAKMYYPVIRTSFFKYERTTFIPIVALLVVINIILMNYSI